MEKSLFVQYVNKWFKPIITKFVELTNGKKEEPKYLHATMLKKEFSTTLKWGSLSADGRVVVADVVSMDSSLPLKKRDSLRKAEGDIPKLGMKLYLNERTMSDINILQATQGREKDIITKLFADTKKCYLGVKEQIEFMFLQALSTGVTVISDANNVGAGIRIDFQHPSDNKFGAINKPWSDADATPIEDIENVVSIAEANGHSIRYAMMDRKTFNNFRKRVDVKEMFAASLGINGNNIPAPTLTQLNGILQDNYGFQVSVIERTVTSEKNGVRTLLRPWGENKVVLTTTLDVGTLTYGQLAEETHKVEGVVYEKADDYILLSKYHKNDPLREYTSSQALAVPVINNVDEIYILDVEELVSDVQTEGDANFDYNGTAYTKQSIVDAITKANPDVTAKITYKDATLQQRINSLSDEEIEVFEANIVAA